MIMKKILALALSLMMLLTCAAAFAENAEKETLTMLGSFEIKYNKLPEYYSMQTLTNTDMQYEASITSSDAAKPTLYLTIAFSDEWDGVNTLADATEEDLAAVKESFYEVSEMNEGDILFEDAKTGLGTPVLVAKAADGAFGAIYTIYLSHEIEVDIFPGADAAGVTEEDVNTVLAFLTDVDFQPLAK